MGFFGKIKGMFKKTVSKVKGAITTNITFMRPNYDFTFVDAKKAVIKEELAASGDKARLFYINMLTSNVSDIDPELLEEAIDLINNASDSQLDDLEYALGDNGIDDWMDWYESNRSGSGSKQKLSDKIAKVEQIIEVLKK